MIEGLYSMEGDLANLPRIIELKERYKVNSFSPGQFSTSDS